MSKHFGHGYWGDDAAICQITLTSCYVHSGLYDAFFDKALWLLIMEKDQNVAVYVSLEYEIIAMLMLVTVVSNRSGVARRPEVGYRDRDHIRVIDRRERRSPRKRSRSPICRRSRSVQRSRSKSRSRSRSRSPRSRRSRSGRYSVRVPKISMDL